MVLLIIIVLFGLISEFGEIGPEIGSLSDRFEKVLTVHTPSDRFQTRLDRSQTGLEFRSISDSFRIQIDLSSRDYLLSGATHL